MVLLQLPVLSISMHPNDVISVILNLICSLNYPVASISRVLDALSYISWSWEQCSKPRVGVRGRGFFLHDNAIVTWISNSGLCNDWDKSKRRSQRCPDIHLPPQHGDD